MERILIKSNPRLFHSKCDRKIIEMWTDVTTLKELRDLYHSPKKRWPKSFGSRFFKLTEMQWKSQIDPLEQNWSSPIGSNKEGLSFPIKLPHLIKRPNFYLDMEMNLIVVTVKRLNQYKWKED